MIPAPNLGPRISFSSNHSKRILAVSQIQSANPNVEITLAGTTKNLVGLANLNRDNNPRAYIILVAAAFSNQLHTLDFTYRGYTEKEDGPNSFHGAELGPRVPFSSSHPSEIVEVTQIKSQSPNVEITLADGRKGWATLYNPRAYSILVAAAFSNQLHTLDFKCSNYTKKKGEVLGVFHGAKVNVK